MHCKHAQRNFGCALLSTWDRRDRVHEELNTSRSQVNGRRGVVILSANQFGSVAGLSTKLGNDEGFSVTTLGNSKWRQDLKGALVSNSKDPSSMMNQLSTE